MSHLGIEKLAKARWVKEIAKRSIPEATAIFERGFKFIPEHNVSGYANNLKVTFGKIINKMKTGEQKSAVEYARRQIFPKESFDISTSSFKNPLRKKMYITYNKRKYRIDPLKENLMNMTAKEKPILKSSVLEGRFPIEPIGKGRVSLYHYSPEQKLDLKKLISPSGFSTPGVRKGGVLFTYPKSAKKHLSKRLEGYLPKYRHDIEVPLRNTKIIPGTSGVGKERLAEYVVTNPRSIKKIK